MIGIGITKLMNEKAKAFHITLMISNRPFKLISI